MRVFQQSHSNDAPPERLQYGPKEAAILLGVSERKVYSLIDDGRLRSYRLDGKRFIRHATLEEFVLNLESQL